MPALILITFVAWLGTTNARPWPFPAAALIRWKPEYAQLAPETRAWYERQKTTPEWRARVGFPWYQYCCDHSDTVEARFNKDGSGWSFQIPGETEWHRLPQDVVQEDIQTPASKPVLFIDATGRLPAGTPVCFFPGAAGT